MRICRQRAEEPVVRGYIFYITYEGVLMLFYLIIVVQFSSGAIGDECFGTWRKL